MANITETPVFEPVRLIESSDYVTGGIGGTANIAPTQLANRTKFLYDWLTKFTGMIVPFALSTPPTGWLELNGAILSRTAYAALWAFAESSGNIITEAAWMALTRTGKFSSGDGSTTFRLPSMRGEFIRSWDNGVGIDIGRGVGTWQADEFKSHSHLYASWDAAGPSTTPAGANFGYKQTGLTGGNETRPRNVAYIFCIKY